MQLHTNYISATHLYITEAWFGSSTFTCFSALIWTLTPVNRLGLLCVVTAGSVCRLITWCLCAFTSSHWADACFQMRSITSTSLTSSLIPHIFFSICKKQNKKTVYIISHCCSELLFRAQRMFHRILNGICFCFSIKAFVCSIL